MNAHNTSPIALTAKELLSIHLLGAPGKLSDTAWGYLSITGPVEGFLSDRIGVQECVQALQRTGVLAALLNTPTNSSGTEPKSTADHAELYRLRTHLILLGLDDEPEGTPIGQQTWRRRYGLDPRISLEDALGLMAAEDEAGLKTHRPIYGVLSLVGLADSSDCRRLIFQSRETCEAQAEGMTSLLVSDALWMRSHLGFRFNDACRYLLTGAVPEFRPINCRFQDEREYEPGNRPRIVLEVDPSASDRDVQEAYSIARAQVLGSRRYRAPEPETIAMVASAYGLDVSVVATQPNGEEEWETRYQAWRKRATGPAKAQRGWRDFQAEVERAKALIMSARIDSSGARDLPSDGGVTWFGSAVSGPGSLAVDVQQLRKKYYRLWDGAARCLEIAETTPDEAEAITSWTEGIRGLQEAIRLRSQVDLGPTNAPPKVPTLAQLRAMRGLRGEQDIVRAEFVDVVEGGNRASVQRLQTLTQEVDRLRARYSAVNRDGFIPLER